VSGGDFPLRLRGEGAAVEAACAVVLVRREGTQFHLGLRRGDESHEPVLHLAWHRYVLDQSLTQVIKKADQGVSPSAVIVLSLDPVIDELLQVLARRVAKRYANQPSSLAYGFGEASAGFGRDTGELTQPDAAFTCATFVLALLRSVGLQILDSERWRAPTEDDLRWQREVGKTLLEWIEKRIHGDLSRATERVEHDIGSRRYRPTDVAAAALFGSGKWPVGAEDVDPRAREMEASLSGSSSSA
jgi:hypothetical protein